jgi:sugar O-acyltransferase (sialic acid O-acetyltransferase NeuD family)
MQSFLNKNDSRSIVILGAGGHAKVLAEALSLSGKNIIGCITPDKKPGEVCFGIEVLGPDSILPKFSNKEVLIANGIGALPNITLRQEITDKVQDLGFEFISIIHPKAIISENVRLSYGVQIMAGVIIQSGSLIGANSIINTGSIIDHDCIIGENCHISPGVVLCGGVVIEPFVSIGAGSSVLQNISIGANSIVASGSVVYKNIDKNVTFIQSKFEINK